MDTKIILTQQELSAVKASLNYLKIHPEYFQQQSTYGVNDIEELYPVFQKLIKWGFREDAIPFDELSMLREPLEDNFPTVMKKALQWHLSVFEKILDEYQKQNSN